MKCGWLLRVMLVLTLASARASAQGVSPARQAALTFMRGVNFSNYLEGPPGTWPNITYASLDFVLARAEGFDHIRLPVAWHLRTGTATNGYPVASSLFTQVDYLVNNALGHGLGILVDWHSFDALSTNLTANTNELFAVWAQVAAHYATAPPSVAFELLNEPHGQATTTALNPIYAALIRQIRLTNPTRTIFLQPGDFGGIAELANLQLPTTESNVIVAVHNYDPIYFALQGATWAGPDYATTNIVFPGPPSTPLVAAAGVSSAVKNWISQYNTFPAVVNPSSTYAFNAAFHAAANWATHNNRPVYLGEFGAIDLADPQSRVNYYAAKRQLLDTLGIGWAIWDWKSGFHYETNGHPDPPGMHAALFPPLALQTTAAGVITCTAAAGKTLVIQRTLGGAAPVQWQSVATQTLASPNLVFADSQTNALGNAFYRLLWQH